MNPMMYRHHAQIMSISCLHMCYTQIHCCYFHLLIIYIMCLIRFFRVLCICVMFICLNMQFMLNHNGCPHMVKTNMCRRSCIMPDRAWLQSLYGASYLLFMHTRTFPFSPLLSGRQKLSQTSWLLLRTRAVLRKTLANRNSMLFSDNYLESRVVYILITYTNLKPFASSIQATTVLTS